MKPDTTILLRLVRASAQGIADECTAILGSAPPADREPLASTADTEDGVPPPAVAEPAAPAPAKRGRKAATPAAEPVVVTTPEPPTNVEPAPAAPTPAAPEATPPQSSITDDELAEVGATLAADPVALRKYQDWRNASEFHGGTLVGKQGNVTVWQSDGSVISGAGLTLAKIPNVGDNRDRVLEAMRRASV